MKKVTTILLTAVVVMAAIAYNRSTADIDSSVLAKDKTNTEVKTETSDNERSKAKQDKKNATKHGVEIPAPLTDRPEQIIQHTGYTLSYNNKHNTPNWSAWQLTAEETQGIVQRSSKFHADPQVSKPYRVDYYDYKGSGYDRGHMCPSADMAWSEEAMHDCFYMSNMCPQDRTLNGGSWKKLEEACRRWAVNEGSIYIVCGPIYKKGVRHEQIGIDHAINVPERFYKVVLSLRKGHEKAIGFLYDNTDEKQPMTKTSTTVDEVERVTGIDFFPSLPDALENKLEATASLSDWK